MHEVMTVLNKQKWKEIASELWTCWNFPNCLDAVLFKSYTTINSYHLFYFIIKNHNNNNNDVRNILNILGTYKTLLFYISMVTNFFIAKCQKLTKNFCKCVLIIFKSFVLKLFRAVDIFLRAMNLPSLLYIKQYYCISVYMLQLFILIN